MTIDLQPLNNHPRLLMEADLKPVQGTRFQPTGFPDLGAAAYDAPSSNGQATQVVLVESAQSMANRLETVCWDEAKGMLHQALTGMPYVSVTLWDSEDTTNSVLEAHRLNSPYIMRDADFPTRFRAKAGLPEKESVAGVFNRPSLARAAFRFDPGSVLHGVFSGKARGGCSTTAVPVWIHRS